METHKQRLRARLGQLCLTALALCLVSGCAGPSTSTTSPSSGGTASSPPTLASSGGAGSSPVTSASPAASASSPVASASPAAASISSPAVAASSGGSGGCNLAYVNSQIDSYKKIPPFTPPGSNFDAKKAAGKKVLSIQESTTNPFTTSIVASMKQVADKVGIEFTDYPNQGQHDQWIQGINGAIAQKVNAIVVEGGTIGPKYFAPQATQAKEAGIPIVTVVDTDLSQPAESDTAARVAQPYVQAARLDVDWIISQTQCKANVLVLTSNELIAGDINSVAAKDEFEKYCGSDCQVQFVNVPLTDWTTKIQPTVQSAIQSDPNLNYIFPLYDAMSQFVLPAIQLAGASGRVHVASFNGTPFVLAYIQNGDVGGAMTMDVGEAEDYLGYAAMDQVMRILAGGEPIASGDEHIPLRVFDKSNVDETGRPPQFGTGFGTEWQTGYEKMWGLAS